MWSLPGGHIEANETPQECIEREIKEELGIELKNIKHFVTSNFQYGEEHTFYIKSDIDIDNINLKEGQGLEWFGKEDMGQMNLAYEDKSIALKFLKSGL